MIATDDPIICAIHAKDHIFWKLIDGKDLRQLLNDRRSTFARSIKPSSEHTILHQNTCLGKEFSKTSKTKRMKTHVGRMIQL